MEIWIIQRYLEILIVEYQKILHFELNEIKKFNCQLNLTKEIS